MDLIGEQNIIFGNYFPQESGRHYKQLQSIEKGLKNRNDLNFYTGNYFVEDEIDALMGTKVDDDHKPFHQRGEFKNTFLKINTESGQFSAPTQY